MKRRHLVFGLGAACIAGTELMAETASDPHAGHSGHGDGHGNAPQNPEATKFNVRPSERILRQYAMPALQLTDQNGRQRRLAQELKSPGPVFLNFIFTTCPGICPMLSALFAQTADIVGRNTPNLRYWSVSIDPSYDTPERLSAYAKLFNANYQWSFFTGAPMAVRQVRSAFDADDDNKMAHRSLILLRTKRNQWLRFEGDHSATTLAAEARAALAT